MKRSTKTESTKNKGMKSMKGMKGMKSMKGVKSMKSMKSMKAPGTRGSHAEKRKVMEKGGKTESGLTKGDLAKNGDGVWVSKKKRQAALRSDSPLRKWNASVNRALAAHRGETGQKLTKAVLFTKGERRNKILSAAHSHYAKK